MIRTRFAPSPTGFLHVGGVRTALFSWLYAKHLKGEFLLRIEDTDRERSTKASVQAILDGLEWLGLDYDLGPFYQTERYSRYQEIVEQLLTEGKAYYCNCSKERLEKLRESQMAAKEKPRYDGHCRNKQLAKDSSHVVRFKNPTTGTVHFDDQVYGNIHIDNDQLDDLIIIRSDGHPTYNFAVVIDDFDMGITHVIRGDDHINNTPRQINLFKALNATIPVFAHLPMILGADGKRLSKRHGAVSVLQFKEEGYLPHALLNYLVRLGWSSGDKEIFSVEEMIQLFDLKHISRGASSFNYEKLVWLNQHYQKSDSPKEVAKVLRTYFDAADININNGPDLAEVVVVQAERCKTIVEMRDKSLYFYQDEIEYDENAFKKHLRPVVLEPLKRLFNFFENLSAWEKESLQECINSVCTEFNINMGKLAQPLRVAITGSGMSPSIDSTLYLIGKQRVLNRLSFSLNYIEKRIEQGSDQV